VIDPLRRRGLPFGRHEAKDGILRATNPDLAVPLAPLFDLSLWRLNCHPKGMKAKSSKKKIAAPRRWSQHVTETSNALDLDPGVFTLSSPRRIAASLKRSAESSARRKASPFQSAMSMLNFYMNRAGRALPEKQKRVLAKAKDELRRLFGKAPSPRPAHA